MSETRRYNLTLTKVPRAERDKFRALRRPDTYREIRPGDVGERVAYRVEMSGPEYEQARRDAEDPRSNLVAVEEDQVGTVDYSGPVPDGDTLAYLAADRLAEQGADGRGVDVGVIDSGLGRALVDGIFAGRIKAAKSFVEADPLADTTGHGSEMAGLAVPSLARIVVGQVVNSSGFSNVSDLTSALYWMVDEAGVDVINASISFSGSSTVLGDAVAHVRAKNALLFCSAGNEGNAEPRYPAAYPDALAISNFDRRSDSIAPSSSYGEHLFAATGGMAIYEYHSDGLKYYDEDGGTSAASSLAAGIAASLISNPDKGTKRDPDMVRHYLAKTARKTGAGPLYEGSGVLQAAAVINAIRKERPECPPGTVPATTTTEDIRFVQDASGAVVQVK